jgi:hypothetical protein
MKQFMDTFSKINGDKTEDETIALLVECVRISMQQYYPEFAGSAEDVEDNFDLKTIYQILDIGAGIKINPDTENVTEEASDQKESNSWDSLDLVKLETEVFMLGIWKNYEELETSLCMQELIAIIESIRELNLDERRFLAAIQGIDLEGGKDSSGKERGQKEWEDMKARVFSRGKTGDSNDILALQGQNARKAGFGIGMGIDFEDMRDPKVMKNNK